MSSLGKRAVGKDRRTVEIAVERGITLGQLLKLSGTAGSGGHAKALLAEGGVTVNGEPETRRGRQLVVGDMVGLSDRVLFLVEGEPGTTADEQSDAGLADIVDLPPAGLD